MRNRRNAGGRTLGPFAWFAAVLMVAVGAGVPSASAAGPVSYQDSFGRSTSSGWGRADVGGSWSSPTASRLSVAGGKGRMEIAPGRTAVAEVGGSGSSNMDLIVDVSADRAPTGGGQYLSLVARGTERTGYRLTAKHRPNGDIEMSLRRYVDRKRTVLSGARVSGLLSGGGQTRMRLVVQGSAPTILKAKVWRVGQSEPADWTLTKTDSSAAVPSSNRAGVLSYLSSSATDSAVRVQYDNFRVSAPSTSPESTDVTDPPSNSKPDASSTGVPGGVTLKALTRSNRPYSGDTIYSDGSTLIINTPNAVYDGWRFDMFVEVRAPGVRITNSHLRGAAKTSHSRGLLVVSNASTSKGRPSALIEDSTLIPRSPSNLLDGVRGSNVTLRRVEISGTVDGVRVLGTASRTDPQAGNVSVQRSWIHDLKHFNDSSHSDGTHNDGVQIMGGSNINITGSRIDGSIHNAGVMITQGRNNVSNVTFSGNWAAGGACTVNVSDKAASGAIRGLAMNNNVFTRGTTRIKDCAMIVTKATRGIATATSNTWRDGSTPAPTMKNGG